MLDKKVFNEFKEDILGKGYLFRMDWKSIKISEFAEVVLVLTNQKCSNPSSGILEIETVEGTNFIYVYSRKKEIKSDFLMNFTDDVELVEEIEIVNVGYDALEESGIVKDYNKTFVKGVEILG